MLTLIKFELKKIYAGWLGRLLLLGVCLLSVLLNFSGYLNMYAFDGVSREGKGAAAVEIDKELAARYAGPLTDEKVQLMLADLAPRQDLHGLNAAYLYQNATQSALFYRFADLDGSWNGRSVAEALGLGDSGEAVKIGYVNGWLTTSQNLVRVMIALAVVVIVLLSPVFAGEYAGVDNLILTSRHGRGLACLSKILAAALAALLTTGAVLALHLGLALFLYGAEGLDCSILFAPVDFAGFYIPFNITCGQLLSYQIVLALSGALGAAGLSLFLSALCRNRTSACIAAAALYMLPFLVPVAENSPLFKLVALLPVYQAQFVALMSVAQMDDGLLYAIWSLPLAAGCAVLGSWLAWRVFAAHQVA